MSDGPENQNIQRAARLVEKAIAHYGKVVRQEQEKCRHGPVIHMDYRSDSFGHCHARRICVACGYEETSMWGHSAKPWSGENSGSGYTSKPKGEPLRLTTEFVKEVDARYFSISRYRPQWP